jgi:hypothetical protein
MHLTYSGIVKTRHAGELKSVFIGKNMSVLVEICEGGGNFFHLVV